MDIKLNAAPTPTLALSLVPIEKYSGLCSLWLRYALLRSPDIQNQSLLRWFTYGNCKVYGLPFWTQQKISRLCATCYKFLWIRSVLDYRSMSICYIATSRVLKCTSKWPCITFSWNSWRSITKPHRLFTLGILQQNIYIKWHLADAFVQSDLNKTFCAESN